MAELIALSVFLGFALLFVGAVYVTSGRRTVAAKRLMAVTADRAGTLGIRDEEEVTDRRLRLAYALIEKLGFWSQATFQSDEKKRVDILELLSHAGFRGPKALPLYNGIRLLLALSTTPTSYLVARHFTEGTAPVSIAALATLVALYLPRFYLNWRINRRRTAIVKALPDVLDMLTICVEAGLGLNAAIDRVAKERTRMGRDVLGMELKYMTYELQAGLSREQAFHNLGNRNGVEELKALAAFMIQSDKLGGSIAEALKVYAEEVRNRRRQRAQEMANKAAVKLLFPLVFFIFPTMFIVILAPAIIQLSRSMSTLTP
ncbi:MAG: type II secretion system F family protein [Candidatus Dadabacteria bacterium]|nr:MAG: type II secretion system F family protein [Candidatus Dadabacteria bacterium]